MILLVQSPNPFGLLCGPNFFRDTMNFGLLRWGLRLAVINRRSRRRKGSLEPWAHYFDPGDSEPEIA